MKKTACYTLFVIATGIVVTSSGTSAEKSPVNKTHVETNEKLVKRLKTLATCLTYFDLARESFRRDQRLKSRDHWGAEKTIFWLIKALVKTRQYTMKKFYALKSDIDDVMYLKIDRETRNIGILVDEYDAQCQFLADNIARHKRKYEKERK